MLPLLVNIDHTIYNNANNNKKRLSKKNIARLTTTIKKMVICVNQNLYNKNPKKIAYNI